MRRISKKTLSVCTAALLLTGGLAWAFSSGGNGEGSLKAGEARNVTLNNDPVTNLWPSIDFTAIPVTYSNTNPGPVNIINPQVEVEKVLDAAGQEVTECATTMFIIQQFPAGTYTLPKTANGTTAPWPHAGASIRLRRVAPDACQGTTAQLRYSSALVTTPPLP